MHPFFNSWGLESSLSSSRHLFRPTFPVPGGVTAGGICRASKQCSKQECCKLGYVAECYFMTGLRVQQEERGEKVTVIVSNMLVVVKCLPELARHYWVFCCAVIQSIVLNSRTVWICFRYDFILASETVYSRASYHKFHSVMAAALKKDGEMFVCCYFYCHRHFVTWVTADRLGFLNSVLLTVSNLKHSCLFHMSTWVLPGALGLQFPG